MKITAYKIDGCSDVVVASHADADYLWRNGCIGQNNVSKGPPAGNLPKQEMYFLMPEETLYVLEHQETLGCVFYLEHGYRAICIEEYMAFLCDGERTWLETKYAAYKHYKQKGWIVKNGLKYGVDYLLYSGYPGDVHSTYATVVYTDNVHWIKLIDACRICESIKKKLLIAAVVEGAIVSILAKRWDFSGKDWDA